MVRKTKGWKTLENERSLVWVGNVWVKEIGVIGWTRTKELC